LSTTFRKEARFMHLKISLSLVFTSSSSSKTVVEHLKHDFIVFRPGKEHFLKIEIEVFFIKFNEVEGIGNDFK
jgi:hypothetical protein